MNIEHKLNDRIAKLIAIPLIAILFPNITGPIANDRYSMPLLLLQYAYFIFLIYLIWKGNVWVILMLKSKMDVDKSDYHRYIFAILFFTIAYSGLFAGCMLKVWSLLYWQNKITGSILLNATLALVFTSVFITTVYENYLLNKKKLNALSKVERMSLSKTQAELAVLKSQIDPHFIFNSLNTLSYLISFNRDSAKLYTDTLAKVYQYILINKDKDLVLLREEIEFISNYFYLLRIRFDKAIRMMIEINDIEAEELLIPPISMQILIENAVKHNEFDEANPLIISVFVSSRNITVSNPLRKKGFLQPGSKIGLTNLDNRYRFITNRSISVDASHHFTVKLPLINLNI